MNLSNDTITLDIADLDCIFLSYDEPRRDENWAKIKHMVPWAKRVHGVKGSDAAHKAAASASKTDRFVLIDGDNIPDAEFFDQQLLITSDNRDCVFRWKARNIINGLRYGNGGISCWPKSFVENMRTHENTDGRAETLVEFCFDPKYWSMHDCYSTTYPNATEFQAWRAGFREGVKMCLDRGRKPALSDFQRSIHNRNLDNLVIWQSVGADVEHGFWAIYGARCGTHKTMLTDWDYTQVQDFDELQRMWSVYQNHGPDECNELGDQLRTRLGLEIVNMDPEHSEFFKRHYRSNFTNKGIMTRD